MSTAIGPGTPGSGRFRTAATGLSAVAAAVLAMIVGLTRQPGSAVDNVWAEDGSRFLTNAYQTPLYRAVLLPYSAYLHLYPRLAGATAAALGVDHAAAVLSGAGCLATAAAAAAVVVSLRTVITRLPLRVLAAVALPLLPNAGSAATGDVANAHVWLDLLALVMLLRPVGPVGPGGRRSARAVETAAAWVAVVLAIGSDPQALVLLAVVAIRIALILRSRRRLGPGGGSGLRDELVTAALLLVVGTVQLVTVARNAIPRSAIHPTMRELGHLYLRDVVGQLVLGSGRSVVARSSTLRGLVLLVVAVLVVTTVASRVRALLAFGLLVLSVLLWAFAPWLKWTPALAGHPDGQAADGRYTVLSAAIVVLAVAVCLDGWLGRVPWPAALAVAAVLAIAGGIVWGPSESLGADRVPSWSAGVRAARLDCGLPSASRVGTAVAVVPVAPRPFVALVPCSRLR